MKIPPLPKGNYRRQWIKCGTCGRVTYYDFIPYSLGNPIRTMPCSHRFQDAKDITTEQAYRALLEKK